MTPYRKKGGKFHTRSEKKKGRMGEVSEIWIWNALEARRKKKIKRDA